MMIIDSQVHAYEANTPKRPWHKVPNWPDHVTGDEMVAAMDKVGVDGAIFISPFALYQYDGSYAEEVQRAHPGRLAIIKPVDPDDPAVADVVAAVDEPLRATRCQGDGPGCMTGGARCLTHDLWVETGRQLHSYLAGVSLADVLAGRLRPAAEPVQ